MAGKGRARGGAVAGKGARGGAGAAVAGKGARGGAVAGKGARGGCESMFEYRLDVASHSESIISIYIYISPRYSASLDTPSHST